MHISRKFKVLLAVLALAAIWYFLIGKKGQFPRDVEKEKPLPFSFGAAFNRLEYDKTEVYEPLSSALMSRDNQLPAAASLLEYAPKRLHQGEQGSCVGWACSYAAHTILYVKAKGADPDNAAFSPSFLFNQVANDACSEANLNHALKMMMQQGDLPFSKFEYNDRSCSLLPNEGQAKEATNFRIKDFNRLTQGVSDYRPNLAGVKQHLSQGFPVIVGMQVGGSFVHQMTGNSTWLPTQDDYQAKDLYSHALCVIGYDDHRQAVQVMNSWGTQWGNDGVAWIPYSAFQHFTLETYSIYLLDEGTPSPSDKLAIKCGLVENETLSGIPMIELGNGEFQTRHSLPKETKFKVAVTNSASCYIYIFSRHADEPSDLLFPYNEKISPYFTTTGTRHFPKDHFLMPAEAGQWDFVAVLSSKERLDDSLINSRINTSRQESYPKMVREAIGREKWAQGITALFIRINKQAKHDQHPE